MSEGNITIRKQEYFNLRLSQEILDRLEAGGVDNWDWYSDSLNPDEGESLEEFEERLKKEILGG